MKINRLQFLYEAYKRTGSVTLAAAEIGVCRQTASKHLRAGEKLPDKSKARRHWRTRPDPLALLWDDAEAILVASPHLKAERVFEVVCQRHLGRVEDHLRRTFQRRVKLWREKNRQEQTQYSTGNDRPGKRLIWVFINMVDSGITLDETPYPHVIHHCLLPYSGWQWATVFVRCKLAEVKMGLRAALIQFKHIPQEIWTDSYSNYHGDYSTYGNPSETRLEFTQDYLALVAHYRMQPFSLMNSPGTEPAINPQRPHNFSETINQHLLHRGSRNFESIYDYVDFLEGILMKNNSGRLERLRKERAAMRYLKKSYLN